MGAKAPEKLKLRRSSCKCDVCGRKFLNASGLVLHRKSAHKTIPLGSKGESAKPPDLPETNLARNKVMSPGDSKIGAQTQSKNVNKIKLEVVNVHSNDKKTKSKKKTEFKCPKCSKVFSVYFSAYRHIQKTHCVDKNDQPVQPNSSDLIRPIRVELFEGSNNFSPISEEHMCKSDRYMCLGCQKTFDSLVLFEQHVKELHTYGAECLFFPNNNEFTAWKTDLETIAKIKFRTLAPSAEKSKQIYHCSHQPAIQADKTLLCPSSLMVTELINGYQVLYFKDHFGHSCSDLLQSKYKKHSILPYLKDIEIKNIDADEHVYDQFKSIMTSVTVGASKANMGVLYSLLDKALHMTLLLNNMSQEEEEEVVNKTMTDDQITKVLSEVKTFPSKRKAEAAKKDLKQSKPDIENNENIKTDTVINKPLLNKSVAKKAVQSLPSTPVKKVFVQSSPSFNDSYKDFVDQNFKAVMSDSNVPKKNTVKKKAVVKTKIGQFKVKPSLSPKSPAVPSPTSVKVLPEPPLKKANTSPKRADSGTSKKADLDIPSKKTEPMPTKRTKPSLSPKRTQLSVPPKKTKVSLSPKTLKPVLSPKTLKPVLSPKTLKPVLSPKTPKSKATPVTPVGFKIKPDFKYEVKEQENDCNILILKF